MPKRNLQFQQLDDVRREIDRLLREGYTPGGKWNLAQICNHLDCWMRYPMDGFPRSPLPIALIMKLIRLTIGKRSLRRVLSTRSIQDGMPTIPESVFQPDSSTDRQATERFLQTIDRFAAFRGTLHASPLLGTLTPDEWLQLQLIHASHHLGFLLPASGK